MDDSQPYQPVEHRSSQLSVDTIDPSQLDRSSQIFSDTYQGSKSLFGDASELLRPFLFDKDHSRSTALSPVASENQHYDNSASNYTVDDSFSEDSGILKLKALQKRPRGRQMGVVKRRKQAAFERQVNAPPSKASIKRAELIALHGAHMIASDEELKGMTRPRAGGYLEWKEPGTGEWLAAAPHDWFRQDFINIANTDEPYRQPPEQGLHPLDLTSNCSFLDQNTWTFDRQGWDDIKDSEGNKVMFFEKAPARFHEFPQGKYLRYKELIMLDPDDRPVLDWACIPLVFSSKLEGGRMEALKRVFPWLKNADFRARMPRKIQTVAGALEPLPKYSTFGQRMSRFRDRSGCGSWTERAGTVEKSMRKIRHLTKDAKDTLTDGPSSESVIYDSSHMMKGETAMAHENSSTGGILERKQTTTDLGVSTSQNQQYDYSLPLFPMNSHLAEQTTPTTVRVWQHDESVYPQFDVATPLEDVPIHKASADSSPAMQSHLTDFRFEKPQTIADKANIKAVLRVTRAEFRSRHGFEAPDTPKDETYHAQYQILQQKHAHLWIIDDSPPLLIGIGPWFGSFDSWPTPHLSQEQLQRLLSASNVS